MPPFNIKTGQPAVLCIIYWLSPFPVAAQFKWWVCGRSFAGIAGSNPVGGWMAVSCDCCVLSDKGLCAGPISHPYESYRVCVSLGVIRHNSNLLHIQLLHRIRSE